MARRTNPAPDQQPPSENRPSSPSVAPDPSDNYERSHPEHEAGMGRLDNNNAIPAEQPDHEEQAVKNRQEPRQLNADDTANDRDDAPVGEHPTKSGRSVSADRVHGASGSDQDQPLPGSPPDHSMNDEQPLGWDQAPQGPQQGRDKRHSRTGGKGGTPDAGEPRRSG